MSSDGDSGRFWGVLINHCHRIMPMIDWTRSHPDNIHHFCSAYGIDAGRQYFLHVWFDKFPSFLLGSNWNFWKCVFNVLAYGFTCRIWHLQQLKLASQSFLSICFLLPIVCQLVESLWDWTLKASGDKESMHPYHHPLCKHAFLSVFTFWLQSNGSWFIT